MRGFGQDIGEREDRKGKTAKGFCNVSYSAIQETALPS